MPPVPRNTAEQLAAIKAADARWAEERKWPTWDVVIVGDEVEWEARPGVNEDDDGVPQPWRAEARATVTLKAPDKKRAELWALQANPTYHTADSATQRK